MRRNLGFIILAILIIAGFATIGIILQRNAETPLQDQTMELTRKLATTLESHGLWGKAIDQYSKLLQNNTLSGDDRAKISYHVAGMYMDRLYDPESALPYLLTTKLIESDSELGVKADKRIVEALEKAGRSIDAANYLATATSAEQQETPKKTTEIIVAKVGNKTITLRELDDEIQSLPTALQEQYKAPERKVEFLQNLIARRLLLIAANRAEIDRDPEIERAAQKAREAAIIAKYHEKAIESSIRITDADVRAYYESHKDDFMSSDERGKKIQLTYDQAKKRARALLEMQRRREGLDAVINRLQQSEGVEIYSDRISGK